MPLNKAAAKARLRALLANMATRTDNSATAAQQCRRDYAEELVELMADLMTSATITGTVTTAGTPTNHTGTITTATIS
jgi:hypothetical protein